VVLGNVINFFKYDLIAKYANAWDSIKSPSYLNLSITKVGQFNNLLMLLKINLFFLPPPEMMTILDMF